MFRIDFALVLDTPVREEQRTELLEQLDEQLARIPALLDELLDAPKTARMSSVGDRFGEIEQDVLRRVTEDLEDRLARDRALRRPAAWSRSDSASRAPIRARAGRSDASALSSMSKFSFRECSRGDR